MTRKILTGNQAVALGALRAGVKVAAGYPGTPSTGCIAHLLTMDLPDRTVQWSTNEKVAFEVASGAAWAGQRALATMKMSGVNVAYDALISIAYSGINGGLVIYVADDPGVSAGMPEQDTRGFAAMSDLPVIEPFCAADAYRLTRLAFELSEAAGAPVFLRLTTAVALGSAIVDVEEGIAPPLHRDVVLERDIARYTKAGSRICLDQHAASLERLERARGWIHEKRLNELRLTESSSGLGIVTVGAVRPYLEEALDLSEEPGCQEQEVSLLHVATSIPFPRAEASRLLERCGAVLVLEELEPHVERELTVLAHQQGFAGRIVGKLDGTLSRIGEYGVTDIVRALHETLHCSSTRESRQAVPLRDATSIAQSRPAILPRANGKTEERGDGISPAPRPITVCAGCPHRGTYLAIARAIKKAGLANDEVMVTGDIGCTILGMNPPFDLLWTEVSMGSSVSLAQGYVHAGVRTPVIATIGDSTFFHGGIPGLLNAIQHGTPLTLVILDNGWTSMTGMQVNPGTNEAFQPEGGRRIDLAKVVEGLGPDRLDIVDPYDVPRMTDVLADGLACNGVKVVLARQECAIQARRRGINADRVVVIEEKCILCKRCLRETGCPALSVSPSRELEDSPDQLRSSAGLGAKRSIRIDAGACNGCGICVGFCPTGALTVERRVP